MISGLDAARSAWRILRNCLRGGRSRRAHLLRDITLKAVSFVQTTYDIPYTDYAGENALYLEEITGELNKLLRARNDFDVELYTREFEHLYADFCGVSEAVGLASGTAALTYSLLGLGIGPGDEVITTPHTYIATVLAIMDAGAVPVFVDTGADFSIDPAKIEEKINLRTKALLPVHAYGRPCALEAVVALARKYRLALVEDACQAQGAAINGAKVGSFGEAGCFSFHPSKFISGLGDGGMLVTSDPLLAQKAREMRQPVHNSAEILKSHRSPCCLDPAHIPFLKVKLRHFREIVAKRRTIAQCYDSLLAGVSQATVIQAEKSREQVYWNYVLRVQRRDELLEYLLGKGIQSRVFCKIPLHLRNECRHLGYREGDFPSCEQGCGEIISLPISHTLPEKDAERVAREIRHYSAHRR
jgi:dTDP-4-amino-4,6-dideoxygalactose transaminase